jgi:hypothetical protein
MSPEGIALRDEEYWHDLLKCEPVTGISCKKNINGIN